MSIVISIHGYCTEWDPFSNRKEEGGEKMVKRDGPGGLWSFYASLDLSSSTPWTCSNQNCFLPFLQWTLWLFLYHYGYLWIPIEACVPEQSLHQYRAHPFFTPPGHPELQEWVVYSYWEECSRRNFPLLKMRTDLSLLFPFSHLLEQSQNETHSESPKSTPSLKCTPLQLITASDTLCDRHVAFSKSSPVYHELPYWLINIS